MKYGSQEYIKKFAKKMTTLIWQDHGEDIKKNPGDWVVVSPAYLHVKTSAVLLADSIREIFNTSHNISLEGVTLKRRATNNIDFGSLQSVRQRQAHIYNNFYYSGPSLQGKKLLFIEDALVSGTHYIESQRSLTADGGAALENIFGYFLLNVEQSGPGRPDFSLEAAVNHMYVPKDDPEIVGELLKDPDNHITPRVLKYVFSSQEFTSYFCKNLSYHNLSRLYSAGLYDGFDTTGAFKENMKSLRSCVEDKLRKLKSHASVRSLFKVSRDSLSELREKRYAHEKFSEKLALTSMYSLLKFGDKDAVDFFAEKLAEDIRRTHGPVFPGSDWGILTTGYGKTPGAASLLAARVSELLKLPLIQSGRKETCSVSYSNLRDAGQRRKVIQDKFYIDASLKPNMIYIDDATATGAHIFEYKKLAMDKGSQLYPFVILDIESADPGLEGQINSNILALTGPEKFAHIVSARETPVLLRTLKTVLKMPEQSLKPFLKELTRARLLEMVNAMVAENFDSVPAFQETFKIIAAFANSRSRNERLINLPAFESLFVVDDSLSGKTGNEEFSWLAAFRYGDPDVLKEYAYKLANRIKLALGDELKNDPEQWVVASRGYYHTQHSASYLADLVAEILDMERIGVRTHGVTSGTSKAGSAEAAFVSTPYRVRKKRVLFIDNLVVSGSTLHEYQRLLIKSGAREVHPFVVLDVPGKKAASALKKDFIKDETVDKILKDDSAPVLLPLLDFLFKLPSSCLKYRLAKLTDKKIWDLLQAAQAERYSEKQEFLKGFKILESRALSRHLQRGKRSVPLSTVTPRLMVLDYDNTMAPTLSPLPERTREDLITYLDLGRYLAIVSMQPMGKRGLTEFFYGPFMSALESAGKTHLMERIWFFPTGGSSCFRPDSEGRLHPEDPEYFVSILPEEFQELSKVIHEKTRGLAKKVYERQQTIFSVHFPDDASREKGATLIRKALPEDGHLILEMRKTSDPRKRVFHVKPADLSKVTARNYILLKLLKDIEKESGMHLENHQILTAGDKMGTNTGENDDAGFFIMGARNVALGREVRTGADGSLRGTFSVGFGKWLHKMVGRLASDGFTDTY